MRLVTTRRCRSILTYYGSLLSYICLWTALTHALVVLLVFAMLDLVLSCSVTHYLHYISSQVWTDQLVVLS